MLDAIFISILWLIVAVDTLSGEFAVGFFCGQRSDDPRRSLCRFFEESERLAFADVDAVRAHLHGEADAFDFHHHLLGVGTGGLSFSSWCLEGAVVEVCTPAAALARSTSTGRVPVRGRWRWLPDVLRTPSDSRRPRRYDPDRRAGPCDAPRWRGIPIGRASARRVVLIVDAHRGWGLRTCPSVSPRKRGERTPLRVVASVLIGRVAAWRSRAPEGFRARRAFYAAVSLGHAAALWIAMRWWTGSEVAMVEMGESHPVRSVFARSSSTSVVRSRSLCAG